MSRFCQAFQAALHQLRSLQTCMPSAKGSRSSSKPVSTLESPTMAAPGPWKHSIYWMGGNLPQAGMSTAVQSSQALAPMPQTSSSSDGVIDELEARLHGAMQAMESLLSYQQQHQSLPSLDECLCSAECDPSSSWKLDGASDHMPYDHHSSTVPQQHHSSRDCQDPAAAHSSPGSPHPSDCQLQRPPENCTSASAACEQARDKHPHPVNSTFSFDVTGQSQHPQQHVQAPVDGRSCNRYQPSPDDRTACADGFDRLQNQPLLGPSAHHCSSSEGIAVHHDLGQAVCARTPAAECSQGTGCIPGPVPETCSPKAVKVLKADSGGKVSLQTLQQLLYPRRK